MRNRLIGATFFVVLIYVTLFLKIFEVTIGIFLVVGLCEFFRIVRENPRRIYNWIYLIIFLSGLLAMYMINSVDSNWLTVLVTMVMLNDTFAYIVGSKLGRTRFSSVSPNKTLEGYIGGMVVSVCSFLLFYFLINPMYSFIDLKNDSLVFLIVVVIVTLISANIGDLLESYFKRINKVKDSGTIIYGHGGMLDRVDSWIVASIIFYLFLSIFHI